MSRIEPVDPRTLGFFSRLFVRFVGWVTRRKLGKNLSSGRIAAHHPRLLFGRSMMEAQLMGARRVDERLKTLASMRAAMLVGCPH